MIILLKTKAKADTIIIKTRKSVVKFKDDIYKNIKKEKEVGNSSLAVLYFCKIKP